MIRLIFWPNKFTLVMADLINTHHRLSFWSEFAMEWRKRLENFTEIIPNYEHFMSRDLSTESKTEHFQQTIIAANSQQIRFSYTQLKQCLVLNERGSLKVLSNKYLLPKIAVHFVFGMIPWIIIWPYSIKFLFIFHSFRAVSPCVCRMMKKNSTKMAQTKW